MDSKLLNVILLGLGFMFVFTSFQTASIIQKVMINSIIEDTHGEYKGDGYTSLSIVYAVFAIFNWVAPSVITVIGSKWSMVVASLTYAVFIANFLYPLTWALYVASILLGIGAALIWTGQGTYLTLNSTKSTNSRNSGIFWAMFQCSLLFGNLFFFLKLQGETHIEASIRELVYGVFTGICLVGILLLTFLQGGGPGDTPPSSSSSSSLAKPAISYKTNSEDVCVTRPPNEGKTQVHVLEEVKTPLKALENSFRLLKTTPMILISVTSFYTGIELSFFSGIYSAAVGQTLTIAEDPKKYVGLSGIIIGLGEIIGGLIFGILGPKDGRRGRDPIVLSGFLVHVVAFFITFINLPPDSPFKDTSAEAFIAPNIGLALLCSFLLGFGDACFNTQIYSLLMSMYSEDSAPAFALFKFVQSVGAAIAFFYSPYVNLYWQLLILVITGVMGTVTFFAVGWKTGPCSRRSAP